MHLVSCATPQEPLEAAPRTALLADLTEGERWEGFWSSDAYFVRCTRAGGEVEWFRLADDEDKQDRKKRNERSDKDATRVLLFPMRGPHASSGINGATAKPRRQTKVLV